MDEEIKKLLMKTQFTMNRIKSYARKPADFEIEDQQRQLDRIIREVEWWLEDNKAVMDPLFVDPNP